LDFFHYYRFRKIRFRGAHNHWQEGRFATLPVRQASQQLQQETIAARKSFLSPKFPGRPPGG
jgi:hypothetical protein